MSIQTCIFQIFGKNCQALYHFHSEGLLILPSAPPKAGETPALQPCRQRQILIPSFPPVTKFFPSAV